MYLTFLRISIALQSDVHRVQLLSIIDEEEASVNNAEKSMVDYRVQLQRNVDEEGGKYSHIIH